MSDLGYNGFPVFLNYFSGIPDTSLITNDSLSIQFKALLKKDPTTKEKALGELIKLQQVNDDNADALITCWIQMYPKLAIDNSKNVRVLSHQVTSHIVSVLGGGKSLAKYFKSFIPIWLMGTYESDKVVSTTSYKELLVCFANDKEKLDTKVWMIFEEPILQFIESVIMIDTWSTLSDDRYVTKDDSIMKYERVLGSVVLMLNKMILLNQISNMDKVDHILKSNQLWQWLACYLNNGYLFKTILILIKSVFNEGMLVNKDIHKVVSKSFFKEVKLKSSKSNNPVVYKSFILQFWSTLDTLTKFKDPRCKKSFWQLGGSKSFNRLVDYLKLGPCSLDPVYYIILSNFFESLYDQTPTNEDNEDVVLNFSSKEDGESILLKILVKQFTNLPLITYKIKCLECILRVWTLFANELDPMDSNDLLKRIFSIVLEDKVNANILEVLVSSMKQADNVDDILKNYTEPICRAISENDFQMERLTINFIQLLALLDTPEVLQQLLDLISTSVEENESLVEPTLLFQVMMFILDHNKFDITTLIALAPMYIEQSFIDIPLKFLKKLVSSNYHYEDIEQLVDDYFIKIQAVDPNQLVSLLEIKDLPVSIDSEVGKWLLGISTNPKYSQVLLKYLHLPGIVNNILSNSKDDDIYLLLIGKSDVAVSNEILQVCWRNGDNLGVQDYIRSLDPELYTVSFRDFILNTKSTTDQDHLKSLLKLCNDSLLGLLQDYVKDNIEHLDVDSLLISNPLQHNVALVRASDGDKSKPIINGNILKLGHFINNVDHLKTSQFTILCGIISEYILDYNLLNNLVEVNEDLILLRTNLQNKFQSGTSLDLGVVFGEDGSNSNSNPCAMLVEYVNYKDISMFNFYCARLLKQLLDNSTAFEVTTNLTKLSPLLIAAFLKSDMMEHFNKSQQNYDRLKNYVFAEILGVKSNDIMNSGIKWLTLSLNFLDEIETIPSQRLNMVLSQLGKWLESEKAYDPEFLTVRVLLSIFFGGIMNHQPENEKVYELANTLVVDNLETITTTPQSVSLRYFTFKLMKVIIKNQGGDYNELLLDILINKDIQLYDENINNQVVVNCYGALQRVIEAQKPSFKIIGANLDSFYSLVTQRHIASLQRIGVYLLHDFIINEQQEFVIEYQLQKSTLNNNDDTPIEAKLPQQLLDCITTTNYDTITYGKYLWSWLLILDHFKDITYSIRNSYILQVEKELHNLLDFIVYHVDLTKPGLLELEHYDILNDDLELDPQVLLFHLFYLCLKYLGSLTQSWLNGIRDRQLKNRIERFTMKNISPILINEIFEDITKSKNKLSNDLMTLKINQVTNEIKSTYVIDEQTMEMIIKIPELYPLANVTVDGPLRLGVNENQWKAWLLASQRIISLTNGSVLEAIETFNKNVSYHFSGFEECAICYSILHQDHSLPSKTCSTCGNKFHAACLYKWFKSSGGSTCPLCRTAFNFRTRT